jgi:hypothetical protein
VYTVRNKVLYIGENYVSSFFIFQHSVSIINVVQLEIVRWTGHGAAKNNVKSFFQIFRGKTWV